MAKVKLEDLDEHESQTHGGTETVVTSSEAFVLALATAAAASLITYLVTNRKDQGSDTDF